MSEATSEETPLIQLYPPWREAVRLLMESEHESGTLLTFEQLYVWFGLVMPKPDSVGTRSQFEGLDVAFLSQFDRFQTTLLTEHQLALKNSRGRGYVIVASKDQSQWGYEECLKDFRKTFTKGMRRIVHTNLTVLSPAERQTNADCLAKMSAIRSMLSKRGIKAATVQQLGISEAE